jgi:predicted dehydrogenase
LLKSDFLRVGIVGAGLIGRKRAQALAEIRDPLIAAADVDRDRLAAFCKDFPCHGYLSWEEMLETESLQAVVIATPNKFLAPVLKKAARKGCHVLCEKPLGRNPAESKAMVKACRDGGVVLKTGFNHRHHPAIRKAHELVESGTIGRLFFLRARYGHGGRPGYDKEWRAFPEVAGGGELFDRGIHIVDLFRWTMGDF